MKAIIRKLFGERTKKYEDVNAKEYFSEDITIKILQLIGKYNVSNQGLFTSPLEPEIETVKIFLERLSFRIPSSVIKNLWDLNQIVYFLSQCNLNKYLEILELHSRTLFEVSNRIGNINYCFKHIEEFNNLMELYEIPFKLKYIEKLKQINIDKIESLKEEDNKRAVYEIIQEETKVNEHFTDSLHDFTKGKHKESIENSYLVLEKYLKVKTGNHKLDAVKNFAEFQKNFSFKDKGIFSIRPDIIKNKISLIYTIRSEIKSHSDKETFDRNKFLEETARFQLNEVMNCIILLDEIAKK